MVGAKVVGEGREAPARVRRKSYKSAGRVSLPLSHFAAGLSFARALSIGPEGSCLLLSTVFNFVTFLCLFVRNVCTVLSS